MSSVKITTLVIDTSVLPKRPEPADVKEFLDKKILLDWSLVRSIQLHNIKNVVLLGLRDESAAQQLANQHHLAHFLSCVGKEIPIPIPIYEKSRAVDVRVHDLDEEISNEEVVRYLSQYGEVMSIRDEVWKNFFPGFRNGVRVARMAISKPIPTYATFHDQTTLITFKGQERQCFRCGGKAHPKLRCHEAATTKSTTENMQVNSDQYPALLVPSTSTTSTNKTNNGSKNTTQKASSASVPKPAPAPVNTKRDLQQQQAQLKRQRSTEETTVGSKKTNTNDMETETATNTDTGNTSERGYNAFLDPELLFQETYASDLWEHLVDPAERKLAIREYTDSIIYLRARDLKAQRGKNK